MNKRILYAAILATAAIAAMLAYALFLRLTAQTTLFVHSQTTLFVR